MPSSFKPRMILLGGNRGFWHAGDRLSEAAITTGIEGWAFACDGDYMQSMRCRKEDLANYDIIIANSDPHAVKHLYELSQSRPSSSKWVTLIEGDALHYIQPRSGIRGLLDSSDLVGCINKYSKDFFKKFTSARVEYLGIPYPASGVRALGTPIDKRRKEIFLAPMLLSRWNEYFCVKDSGIPFYIYAKRLSRTRKTIIPHLREYGTIDPLYFHRQAEVLFKDPNLRIEKESGLNEFFRYNGAASVWLNLDGRYTWGRYVLDAAALQIPIITTRSTGHAEHFFPQTMLENEFELDKASELVNRLFNDQDFYREVASVPIERFDHLRPEIKKKELFDILYSTT